MTLRGLARGSVLYSIGFVLPRVGTFLLLPVYVSFLSPEDFGAVSLVVSVASLLAVIFRLGMDGALMRQYLDTPAPGRDRVVASIATLGLIVGAVGALTAALVSWLFFAALFSGLAFLPFGAMAAALSFTTTFQYLPATVYRAREEPSRFLAFTGGAFAVTATTTIVLLAVARLGVVGALLGQLCGGLFVIGVSAALLWRSGGPQLDRSVLDRALRFGVPLVPHGLSGWVLNVSDRWLLSFLLPVSALAARSAIGVYSLAYQLSYAIDLLAQSFNAAWVPFFYRYGATAHGPRIHREMTTIVVTCFGALGAILALNASLVVTVFARPAFADAAALVPVLSVAFIVHVFYISLVTVIFFARRTAVLPLISGISAGVNVGANLVLIPALGTEGAAWATLAAFTFMAATTSIAAARVYPMRLDWTRLGLLLVGVVGIAWYARTRRPELDLFSVAMDVAISAAIAAAAFALVIGPIRALRTATRDARRDL